MSRILLLLALLALMLGPVAMNSAQAAPAAQQHHAPSADAHCTGGERSPDEQDRGRSADCALACSAMPCAGAELASEPLPRASYAAASAAFFAGTAPGSDPPPPRLS